MNISIIVPTLNEAKNISLFVKLVESYINETHHKYEIIFVDDDSNDSTSEEIIKISQKIPYVRLIKRVGRKGLTGACVEGIFSSMYDYILITDADMQHDLSKIKKMISLSKKYDLVIGSRYLSEKNDFKKFNKKRASWSLMATKLARMVSKYNVTDPMSGFFW